MPQIPLPPNKVRKSCTFSLSEIEKYPIDHVSKTHELYNESEALRLILKEYARLKSITAPTHTPEPQA